MKNLKNWHLILVFVAGVLGTFIGFVFKIQSWPYGNLLLNGGKFVLLLGVIGIILKATMKNEIEEDDILDS